jgi:endonuclease/exonuclease/phosphatase family metal-dependent hydrolase
MIEKTRSLFKKLVVIASICTVLVYLSVCLVPFINTGKYWYFAFPGLVFPLIFFALVCFIILLAILRSKFVWVAVVALLIGFQQIISVFSFHLPSTFEIERQPNTLRVLQWNVSSWDENHKKTKEALNQDDYRPEMMDLVRDQNADVLCFEEFFESEVSEYFISNISTLKKMGYPYYYYAPTVDFKNDFTHGIAIFSKYPIIDSGKYNLEVGKNTKDKNRIGEHLIFTDIKVNNKTYRIFATHLQSVHFDKSDYQSLTMLKNAKDPGLNDSKTIISKLKKGYISRYEQADLIEQKLKESPYPSIICGDFNDVPNSSTYFKIKGNLKDAFLRKGSFIGRTFRFISPTLRIDYILVDKSFKVNQFRTIHVPYSDHYPVETDLLIQ